jgi:hypothetical protein
MRSISGSFKIFSILFVLLLSNQSPARVKPIPVTDPALRIFYSGLSTREMKFSDTVAGDQSSATDTMINYSRLEITGGVFFGSMIAIHIYQQNGWWKDNRAPFHFQEDLIYGLNVDKIGHFYGADLLTFVISRTLRWSNVPDRSALWLGSAGALLFQTYVEVEDGFSTWGFDRVDFASDVAGAAWPVLQYYVPQLQNLNVRFSYHPSSLLGSAGGSGFKGQKHLMIDDYEGQTMWFCLKVHNVLPGAVGTCWPEFLNLSYGYGVRDVAQPHPYRVYFIAPDLDMTKIIPQSSSFLKTLSEALNFIHMPMPAFRFYPRPAFFGIYF